MQSVHVCVHGSHSHSSQEKNNGVTRVNTEARCGSLKTDHYLVSTKTATAAMWRVARTPSTLKGTRGHIVCEQYVLQNPSRGQLGLQGLGELRVGERGQGMFVTGQLGTCPCDRTQWYLRGLLVLLKGP